MNKLQPPLMAGWMSTLSEADKQKHDPKPFTGAPFDIFTHQEKKTSEVSPTLLEHDSETPSEKRTNTVGVRPPNTVTSSEIEEQRNMLAAYMHSYHSLTVACEERAVQLEKIDAERKR
ncbi:hypothetical protein LSM04_002154 [Trypanosoma melophagium]|uniref:uncharacterized protein n=1 Tax=Trypanosoma melophagium TaxID=715481 RepID=UPI003519E21B|nr:hypothetical protein LSM04_002154 [Trypanosoma melophagium]